MIHTLLLAATLSLAASCKPTIGNVGSGGAFEYCDIHLPENRGATRENLGLNNVDDDWGLWGHHMAFVLTGQDVSERVYATVNGTHNPDQYCFSSEELFRCIESFVNDNYSRQTGIRFSIMPNDNQLVCQCANCMRLGNTPTDATPAVTYMIERLCDRFPDQLFFTSYYATTRNVPNRTLPENAGVLISAMDYPLGSDGTQKETDFISLLNRWSQLTKHVYVWDYINNFDDYFTPFPLFTIFQHRLGLYAEAGVTGLFLNGSGPDFSAMSDIRTYVLAALLYDPYQDWRVLLRNYLNDHYPVTSKSILYFIIEQEKWTIRRHRELPLYGGINEALRSYLPADLFTNFHNELLQQLPSTYGDERLYVEQLVNTLSLTRLELMRLHAKTDSTQTYLNRLAQCTRNDNTKVYSESCWTVQSYIDDYRFMLQHHQDVAATNLLQGRSIQALSPLDEEYTDLSILTDGLIGIASNYHMGHFITSADGGLRLSVPTPSVMKTLRICLSRNPIFRLDFPTSVVLCINGNEVQRREPQGLSASPDQAFVEFQLPAGHPAECEIRLLRETAGVRAFAIDEIEGE